MKEKLFESINITAYFLWEYTHNGNALALWCCAEDIANFFQRTGITEVEKLNTILEKGKYNSEYVMFVRNIAYRIYLYTGHNNPKENWFIAESLITNNEWSTNIVNAAYVYNNLKDNKSIIKSIRSEMVRNFYKDNIQN